jgi:hypothetical protein
MADENKIPKMARPGLGEQQARKKKKKLLSADEFFKIKDSKQEFTGPKSTKGSLGDSVNRFRKMDDEMKKQQKLSKGGRAGYKGGKSVKKMGCAIKGKSPILR